MAGELAYWRWKAGDNVALPDLLAEPYALQLQGDWQTAADAWNALGCPYEQARTLADGDTTAQFQALRIFEQLGARPAADALRNQLQAEGITNLPGRPNLETRANPFGLTARQGEIPSLLTQKLTNAEIAAQLHISRRTVDHHVSAILAKLNVSSRQEAAKLADQPPTD